MWSVHPRRCGACVVDAVIKVWIFNWDNIDCSEFEGLMTWLGVNYFANY